MIIKTISINDNELFFIQDTDKMGMTKNEEKKYLEFLKRNKEAKLLNFEIS